MQNKSTLAIKDASHSLCFVDPQRMKSTTGSFMESPIYAVNHPTEEDPYSFWYITEAEHAQTVSMVFNIGSASFDGASQASHIPSNSFLLGSQVQNGSEAFSIYGYNFNADNSEILKKFKDFKKFDIVEDTSDHHYVNDGTSTRKVIILIFESYLITFLFKIFFEYHSHQRVGQKEYKKNGRS